MSKTVVTYNGSIYQKLELEEQSVEGRYSVVNRTSLTVQGVLDDEAKYNAAVELINNFGKNDINAIFMALYGDGYFKILSKSSIPGAEATYTTQSDAVLTYVLKQGILIEEPYLLNDKIVFKVKNLETNKEKTLYLSAWTNQIAVIGG